MDNFFIALLHYPVYDKNGQVVTTAVVNMDVHDIARSARTYEVKRFYIVTPVAQQRRLVQRIMDHWQDGYGARYNPSRREAFSIVSLKGSLTEVMEDIEVLTGQAARLVVSGAGLKGTLVGFHVLRQKMMEDQKPYLLAFGTGWGIAGELLQKADHLLEPVRGPGDYNHLSVRSAVAVVLDRLWGDGGRRSGSSKSTVGRTLS
ncbi:MAG: RNA methyltransferase [Deltaproteobacteria bacterium]|nr:RNA methyltransferase [Deltaproteobacteria bacterium]